jgi:hypothetical protein
MKLTIESTDRTVFVRASATARDEIECRIWEGHTETGIAVQVLIPRIAVHKTQDCSQFEAELREHKPPSAEMLAFPLRMVL